MKINRRVLMLPALAIGLLGVVPAFAGADEDAVAKKVEAFRAAQAAGNAEGIAPLCAEELSYSHSSGAVDDKAKLRQASRTQTTNGHRLNTRIPRSASSAQPPSCASTLSASRNSPTARRCRKTSHILMNWQKQGADWKLLSRSATKL